MSHIDESRLHEYLDALERGRDIGGKAAERQEPIALYPLTSHATARREAGRWEALERHLAECAECQERLDGVRVVRQRAAGLLRDAAPAQISMPLFAEIEARQRARAKPARRRVFTMNRLTAVGWAATLVLAVGIGWLARGSFGFRQTQELTPIATSVAEPTVEPAVPEADDEVALRSVTEAVQAEPPPAGERGVAGPGRATEDQAAMAPLPEPAADTRERFRAAEDVAQREEQAKAVPAESPTRQVTIEGALEQEARRDQARGAVAAQVADADVVGLQLNLAVAGVSWRPATVPEATQHLGDSLRSVAGLAIDSVVVGEVNGAPAVRVVQMLASGQHLEIVQWRRDDPSAPLWRAEAFAGVGAAQGSAPATIVERDGYVVVLRASVPADSLQALADRVR